MTEESRRLMSKTRIDKIKSGEITFKTKKIYKYNLSGDFIKEYESLKLACEDTGLSPSQITRNLNGKYKRSRGFMWSREYKDKIEPFKKATHDMSCLHVPIYLLNIKTGNIDYEFKSISECSKHFNKHYSVISESIKKNRNFKRMYKIIKK